MKILFLAFTPYHIKVCNYISSTLDKQDCKNMILSSFTGIRDEVLLSYVSKELYNNVQYINLNPTMKEFIRNPIRSIINSKTELKQFKEIIDRINPEVIVYFSDVSIPYQTILNIRKGKSKLVLVEEGTAAYLGNKDYNKNDIVRYIFKCIVFNTTKCKFFVHGNGNYEDVLVARMPELIKSKSQKITLTKDEFRKIILFENKVNEDSIKIRNSTLLCPACTTYSLETMIKVYEDIFRIYEQKDKKLYVKLHPAEPYNIEIRKIIENHSAIIELIDDCNLTSDEIVLNENIDEVISDTSSTLINAYYLREDINIITYINILESKYNVNLNTNISIFKKLREGNYIKNLID